MTWVRPRAMVSVDLSSFDRFRKDLAVLREREIPHAVRDTLNAVAFKGRERWQVETKRSFVLRNTFTQRSLQVSKASGIQVRTMQATFGSRLPYLREQEEGFEHQGQGKHGVAVPTPSAAGMAKKARVRTRQIRRANYLAAINLATRVSGKRQVRNAVAIKMALQAGGFAYLDLGKKQGIFKITGRKRGLTIRMLYDLSKKRTVVKAHPTLERTVKHVAPMVPVLGRKAVFTQLARRLTGYRRRG